MCQISIIVTGGDKSGRIQEKINDFQIPRNWIKVGVRPDFPSILDQHMIERINKKEVFSNSLLAFCGSSRLSNAVHEAMVHANIAAISSGNEQHQMEFVSENYGYS